MDNATFESILRNQGAPSGRDRGWAIVRLIEYAPYTEIQRLLPREVFLREWPALARRIRSRTRREGMEFFYQWLRDKTARHA